MARRSKAKRNDPLAELERLRETAKATDSNPQLVATARFIRGLMPGRKGASKGGKRGHTSPSAARELGSGVMEAWSALSEAQRRKRGEAEVAILFTDLVGFSSWALEAGDEAALELLNEVGETEEAAVSDNGGAVVKRLGDGAMSVFGDADEAVMAALEAQRRIKGVKVEGHTPKLRAGVHVGTPQKVRKDFLGVDVNIAARVGEAAKGNEVLISEAAREALDGAEFRFGASRELVAAGAPSDLAVCSVRAKAKPKPRSKSKSKSKH